MNPHSSPMTTRLEMVVTIIHPFGPFVVASLERGSEPSATGIAEQHIAVYDDRHSRRAPSDSHMKLP